MLTSLQKARLMGDVKCTNCLPSMLRDIAKALAAAVTIVAVYLFSCLSCGQRLCLSCNFETLASSAYMANGPASFVPHSQRCCHGRKNAGAAYRRAADAANLPDAVFDLLQDCARLYGLALVAQLVIFIAYAIRAAHFKPPMGAIVRRVLDMIVHAAPPGVPAVMLFCGGSSRGWLEQKGVELLTPDALKISGETEVAAFDKTGTLTGSLVSMQGLPCPSLLTLVMPCPALCPALLLSVLSFAQMLLLLSCAAQHP